MIVAIAHAINLWQHQFFYLKAIGLDGLGTWLDPELSVAECGLKNESRLEFQVKYYRTPKKLVDEKAKHLFWAQVIKIYFFNFIFII